MENIQHFSLFYFGLQPLEISCPAFSCLIRITIEWQPPRREETWEENGDGDMDKLSNGQLICSKFYPTHQLYTG